MHERNGQLRIAGLALILLVVAAPLAVGQQKDSPAEPPPKKLGEAPGTAGMETLTASDTPKSLWESLEAWWDQLYKLGGRTMIGLAIASIIGLASVLERGIGLLIAAGSIRGPVGAARELWARGEYDQITRLVRGRRGITSRLIDFIVRHREFHAADVSAGVGDLASRYIKRHIRMNYWLAVVATVSPLLGLLGTILGMIEAFEKVNIAGSMGSAEYLSGAISKALITTAAGLIIAIPALFFYHIYKFLTGVLADTLEGKANEMITGWLMRKEAA